MPPWWSWYYYANPLAWGVYGLLYSQLGDDVTHYVIAPPPLSGLVTVQQLLHECVPCCVMFCCFVFACALRWG